MKVFVQKTNRKYRPEIEHPVGKFCLEFMEPDEFLLEKRGEEGYLTSGFPMPESKKFVQGREVVRPETKIQYYDTKEAAQNRIDTMIESWRAGYKIVEVTEKGLVCV